MKKTTKSVLVLGALFSLVAGSAVGAPIFTPDSQPTGWVSRPAVTYFDVSSGTESFYQLDYNKRAWSGDVLAKDINGTANIQTTGPWDSADPTLVTAASLLNSVNYSTGRKIATFGAPFRWDSLTNAEQTALGSSAILNFVRGDRSNEEPNGADYYKRDGVLGDILHSNISFWDDGTNQTLYVGANDGMLHAFNANTGAENWAYIPSMLIPKLKNLAQDPYIHTHFVDGPINIANFNISGAKKTILVGGLGAGGAGLFGLDITSALAADETAVASKVMWEITASGSFADLGHTYGTPVFTRLGGTPVVLIGNGYVNTGNGHAVLYIINAVTGALVSAIDTGSGSMASPNGLSSPTLFDSDGDAIPDYAYAGDIDGQLWKFDLSNKSSSLLLTTSPVQAITTAPAVQHHPLGGQMVAFATGRILTSGDKIDTSTHYAYGVWDGAPGSNTSLVTQTLTTSAFSGVGVRTVTNNAIDWTTGHDKGWKVALMPGERVVGEKPFYSNGRFYFLVTNPTIESGSNWLHELVFNTGGSPSKPIFDLNKDGYFNDADLADNGGIPVAKYLGSGVFSQPRLAHGSGQLTTLYAFHPDLPILDGRPSEPEDPGVSGGHFDVDIFYYGGESGEDYKLQRHVHEYDDKYDVTGVNFLNASEAVYNLENAIPDTNTEFKILVMNQYLNPAALLSVGGASYESVKTYENLASETDAEDLLAALPVYSRDNIETLIYNVPLEAFKSRDWWGDGGIVRPGLIPTVWQCAVMVNTDGSMENDVRTTGNSRGLLGPNGERFNGGIGLQLIKPDTPHSALELAGPDVKYGWRVKQSEFTNYVLAEYTSYWHHPNHICYGDEGWIPDPPEDFEADTNVQARAEGSADPTDGTFGAGLAVDSVVTTVDDNVTTTTTTYSDGSKYIKTETINNDGSTTVYQLFRDGTEETTVFGSGDGGSGGFIDPNTGSPIEEMSSGDTGRQSWRQTSQ